MTGDELLELGRQMTPRPWRDEPEPRTAGGWRAVLSGQAVGPGATVAQWLLSGDAAAIVALANHAGPLVELVQAVERWRAWPGVPDEILWALDRVHAMRDGQRDRDPGQRAHAMKPGEVGPAIALDADAEMSLVGCDDDVTRVEVRHLELGVSVRLSRNELVRMLALFDDQGDTAPTIESGPGTLPGGTP